MKIYVWKNIYEQPEMYGDNISLNSYFYCCLYYFYYGKAFNKITNFIITKDDVYRTLFYKLDKLYKIVNYTSEAERLHDRMCNATLMVRDDFRYLILDLKQDHFKKIDKTINIKDMPECIKKFAIKHEKALYW